MSRVYGRPASNDRREYAGKTDQQIQAEDDDGVDRHADGDVVVIVRAEERARLCTGCWLGADDYAGFRVPVSGL